MERSMRTRMRTGRAARAGWAIAAVLTGLMLGACGRVTSDWDWNQALAANTEDGYEAYIRKHPADPRAENARGRILALQDDAAWSAAQSAGTAAGYEEYLRKESGGVHALEARAMLERLSSGPVAGALKDARTADETSAPRR